MDGECLKMADFYTPNGKMMVNGCGGSLYFQSQMEFYQSLLVLFSPANACNNGMITCKTYSECQSLQYSLHDHAISCPKCGLVI